MVLLLLLLCVAASVVIFERSSSDCRSSSSRAAGELLLGELDATLVCLGLLAGVKSPLAPSGRLALDVVT